MPNKKVSDLTIGELGEIMYYAETGFSEAAQYYGQGSDTAHSILQGFAWAAARVGGYLKKVEKAGESA